MKAKLILGFVVVVLGAACAAVGANGAPTPPCEPGAACPVDEPMSIGTPVPPCIPGTNCAGRPALVEGGSASLCRPGVNCAADGRRNSD